MSSKIADRDSKILCTKSGNRCAIPNCRKVIIIDSNDVDRDSLIGVMAHIKGEKPNSARYDSFMKEEDRNKYENLIFICASCHKMIDDQPNTYTVDNLLDIKQRHEHWIIESTESKITEITFTELDSVTKYLVSNQPSADDSLLLIKPKDKIKKNNLSQKIEHFILMGMSQVKSVASFVEKHPDIEFSERLRQGFVSEYDRLRNSENIADDLFYRLLDFASGYSDDFTLKAAGLAVLVYLFEKCDVFEK